MLHVVCTCCHHCSLPQEMTCSGWRAWWSWPTRRTRWRAMAKVAAASAEAWWTAMEPTVGQPTRPTAANRRALAKGFVCIFSDFRWPHLMLAGRFTLLCTIWTKLEYQNYISIKCFFSQSSGVSWINFSNVFSGLLRRASNAPHRSLPDIPVVEPTGDNNSELYATVGENKVQDLPQGRSRKFILLVNCYLCYHESFSEF